MKKRKVIIDCDPGIDDALALIFALKSQALEILGITIVSGNVPALQGWKNCLKVLNLINRLDIPVYIGEEYPLVRELITAEDTHGCDGLGNTFLPDISKVPIKYGAINFILKTIKKEREVSIIVLGPMTNIAKAMEKDNETFSKVKEIVSMGGTFKSHGNSSPIAEFNYFVDPHAAKYVYRHIAVPFTMVGLDVTREIVLTPNYIELLKQFNTSLSNFIVDITKFYVNFHWKQEKTLGCVINDPLAIAYFIDNSLCSGFNSYVDIATEDISIGQSVVDVASFYNNKPNCFVLNKVNAHRFMELFLKTIFKEFEEDISLILSNNKYSY
ncbi:purine nucleosidase [Clostridium tetanomorphum]|uniref:nucleoside hydrolase n=1 Tax=Clostridium tetanomorphum TaxID=1553 RepID=UPI00044DFC25|nr:nucleoside hydrolase [Clostridium tetanomorphum]KAJ50536.1 IUNH family nucleoside hydrolase [Clostridium tetanomorphum DSM 665]MBP1866337.1 purine nucleosidase [Clostridium tetanomorphum]NRS83231.1 purine nucleosidase [Clostridium tetanomorphum]SQC01279.1 nucleoside hydrolase, IUNH family [Clostridium tetanomorphum]